MKSNNPFFTLALISFGLLSSCSQGTPYTEKIAAQLPNQISFNYHIRPILTDRCFSCHGPDAAARKAELRLDEADSAYRTSENGLSAIHPGKLQKSGAYHRIYSQDPELQMPPPDSRLALSDYEKALISKWIQQGAVYEAHWSFVPVRGPELPPIRHPEAAANAIDHFVLAKLEQQGLTFSPPADKERLIRRLSFDLTGLPPTPAQIDAFLGDDSPQAYEKVVDRLLDSDAYAERMAQDWLDLARYADSQGLHSDGWRSMYPWRDWVIRAFREHMPYDQFLTWQLAGDLLPEPSREQLVATGFNRNHKTTAEGGAVDEEYRAEYVHDRVATTATTFMGLTMECARCHDHKYDPVSQEEYYRFFAFFNQVDELGLTGDDGNAGPNLLLPAPETELKWKAIRQNLQEKESALALSNAELAKQQDFIKQLKIKAPLGPRQAAVYLPFDLIADEKVDRYPASRVSGEAAIALTADRGAVLELNGEYEFVSIRDQGLFEQYQPFSASIWIRPQGRSSSQTIMGNSAQKGTFWRGWDLALDSLNHLCLRLIHALPHDVLAVRTAATVPIGTWTHVAFSYDGSGRAAGIELYIDGKPVEKVLIYDRLQRSIYPIAFSKEKTNTPLRLGKSYRAFTGEYGIYSGQLDEFRLYRRALSSLEVAELAGITSVQAALETYRKNPEPTLAGILLNTWQAQYPPQGQLELAALRQQQQELLDTVPETMIMQELQVRRPTFVLHRGNYNEPTLEVQPGTPAGILPFADTLEANRLGLAKWLLQPEHPLTSRVLVNRIWQQFFGRGLVDTSHDLGSQGSLPTHPQLLDWLAASLMTEAWDIQGLQKKIVLSATYRQSSMATPALREKDPDNHLLARGPSYRLPAEMIRDNALAAGGLLDHRIGGQSVKPIQPAGLWAEKTSSTHLLRKYEPDSGADRYRRSLYTFIRRTSPHPAMTAFDVPNRSVCTAQRPRTNTPMQALVLLNDPQFVEASRGLAQRVMLQETALESRIVLAFRLLTGKRPDSGQLKPLLELYETEKARFAADRAEAEKYIAIGQYPPDGSLEPVDLAAMTLVANTIMNFDDFYMKR